MNCDRDDHDANVATYASSELKVISTKESSASGDGRQMTVSTRKSIFSKSRIGTSGWAAKVKYEVGRWARTLEIGFMSEIVMK